MAIRNALFLLGVLLMGLSLIWGGFPRPVDRAWIGWQWLFSLGLAITVSAHGWPEGLR
jgi:hypothetical protein